MSVEPHEAKFEGKPRTLCSVRPRQGLDSMRRRFVLGSVLLVLSFGFASYSLMHYLLTSRLSKELPEEIQRDGRLVQRLFMHSALRFVDQVQDRAAHESVIGVFGGLDERGRRMRAHEAANRVAAWFQDPTRRGALGKPELVVMTDNAGKVIARDRDPNRLAGASLLEELSGLRRALRTGRAVHDVWVRDGEFAPLQTVIAPIRSDRGGPMLGTLIVAYGLTDGAIGEMAELVNRDIALVIGGDVAASSLPKAKVRALEKAFENPALGAFLEPERAQEDAPTFELQLEGKNYLAIARLLPRTRSAPAVAVVLADKAEALAPVRTANSIWVLTFLFTLIFGVFAWIVVNGVLIPIEEMEEGLLTILSGGMAHRLSVRNEDLAGLAYRINQLIGVAAGEDEDEVAAPASSWSSSMMATASERREPTPTQPAAPKEPIDDPDLAAALGAQPEDEYLSRLFREYQEVKASVGEDASQISEERFKERLLASAAGIAEQFEVRQVRFIVELDGGRVLLRPVLIR